LHNEIPEENMDEISQAAREEKLSELDILKQSLEEKRKIAEDYYDQLLRLRAEFENFRRRAEREKRDNLVWGKEEVLLKQVSLLDVIEQAGESAKITSNMESIQEGLDLITKEFARMLQSEGIVEINSAGQKFDPNLHEAVEQVKTKDQEGIILDVVQKGYTLNGRVIRPAKVKVAVKEIGNE
jgi:molecular chaperone GrpE